MQEPRITLIILKLFEERILECARLLVLFIDLYDFFNHNQGFLAPQKEKPKLTKDNMIQTHACFSVIQSVKEREDK